MHGCVMSTLVTDALILRTGPGNQAISIDAFLFKWTWFIQKYYIYSQQHDKLKLQFEKNTQVFKG